MTGALLPGQVESKPGISFGAMWDALIHDAGCAVVLLDAELMIVGTSAQASQIHGIEHTAMIGRCYSDVLRALGMEHRCATIERVLSTGKPQVVRYVFRRQAMVLTCRAARFPELPGGRGVLLTCRPDSISDHVDPSADVIDERERESNPLSDLTPRERQVLECIAEGYSSAEIAKKLHRSVKTIEGHRARLGYKLGARNRSELTRLAIALGLVRAAQLKNRVAY